MKKKTTILLMAIGALAISAAATFTAITFAGFQDSAKVVKTDSSSITVNSNGAREIVYLRITADTDWLAKPADFYMSQFNNSSIPVVQKWVSPFAKDEVNHVYSFYLETATYDQLLFARVNPNFVTPSWGDESIWNSTVDLTFNSTKRYYTVSNAKSGDKYTCTTSAS